MNESRLNRVSKRLTQEKHNLTLLLPKHLRSDFTREAYISGGCIYSLYNDKEPKDFDFFVESETFVKKLRNFFMSLIVYETYNDGQTKDKKIYIVHYNGERVVVTKNAISIGKYQIITKFFGKPEVVVGQFDFMHNTYWHDNDGVHAWNQWDFLDSTQLIYNEERARDISGTIMRVSRFVARGMTITNAEMAKMLRKLREVGFTERENEIIDNLGSY